MATDNFQQKLQQFCQSKFEAPGKISNLVRLSGGASMESWSFSFGNENFVLRRLPDGIADDEYGLSGISLDKQADIIEAARRGGVTAPKVRARLSEKDGLGEGFIMEKVEGETLPHRILGNSEFAEAEIKLIDQSAKELARIHALDVAELPDGLDMLTPEEMIKRQRGLYQQIGGGIPVYDFALRWLGDNIPKEIKPRALHGDFRMGNLIIDKDGIAAVLDWELVHFGDPAQDVAYFCTPSWRFGNYDKHAGGIDSADALLLSYARESGRIIEPERFQFWLVYSTLWWGIACMVMGDIWRSGADRTLERTVIGRRVSEVEIDLLLLFEDIIEVSDTHPLKWQAGNEGTLSGETGYDELLAALLDWNNQTVLPTATGHTKFQSRVAGNALGIAQRQAAFGPAFHADAAKRMAELGCSRDKLCDELFTGKITHNMPGLWNHLRLTALERLTIDQPKYAGFHAALKKWTQNGQTHE